MAELEHVLYNTLEQVLSSDANLAQDFAGRHVQDILLGHTGGPDPAANPPDVVVQGLDLVPGAGLTVDLEAGTTLKFDAAPPANGSQYRFGRLPVTANQALAAADPVNPRIDRLSYSIADVDSDSQVRNVLVLPARTVTPTAVNKLRSPTITVTITAGTPGAAPTPPATPAGETLAWDVYVPAAFVGPFTTDHLIDHRRRLAPAALDRHERLVGMWVGNIGNPSLNVTTTSGRSTINGAPASVAAERTETAASIREPGGGALAASTEYHVYVFSKGSGAGVAQAAVDDLILSLSTTAPNTDGRPSAPINYDPLQGTGLVTVAGAYSGGDGLYLGTVRTNAASNVEPYGAGIPLTPDGAINLTDRWAVASGNGGRIGTHGYGSVPRKTWTSATEVTFGPWNGVVIGWEQAVLIDTIFDITIDRATGVGEVVDTWYYCYWRLEVTNAGKRGAVHTIVPIISDSPPDAIGRITTPEAGFSANDYLYAGSFFNNTASDIEPFFSEGNRTLWRDRDQIFNAIPATAPALSTVSVVKIPESSRMPIVMIEGRTTNGGAGVLQGKFQVFYETGTTNHAWQFEVAAGFTAAAVTANGNYGVNASVVVDAAGDFEVNQTVAGVATTCLISEVGYVEDVERPRV